MDTIIALSTDVNVVVALLQDQAASFRQAKDNIGAAFSIALLNPTPDVPDSATDMCAFGAKLGNVTPLDRPDDFNTRAETAGKSAATGPAVEFVELLRYARGQGAPSGPMGLRGPGGVTGDAAAALHAADASLAVGMDPAHAASSDPFGTNSF